jgi:hypothetical protein
MRQLGVPWGILEESPPRILVQKSSRPIDYGTPTDSIIIDELHANSGTAQVLTAIRRIFPCEAQLMPNAEPYFQSRRHRPS